MKYISLFLSLIAVIGCSSSYETINSTNTLNEEQHSKTPTILLVSIDGYRHDYNEIHKPTFLTEFQKESASLKSLVPTFPTKTFPNHLSIITGMYPMNHGIVANHFYNPELEKYYSLKDRSSVTNPDFYKTIPLWSLAESQGMRTATYFWPGSEARIANHFPTHYMVYNHSTPHEKRIQKVKEWLKLPKSKRPHLITLYYHDVDSAGHRYGPLSDETKDAISRVDKSLKDLNDFIQGHDSSINIIIVSDHGMQSVKNKKINLLNKVNNLDSKFIIQGSGPLVHFYLKKKEEKGLIQATLEKLNTKSVGYKCYLNNETPPKLNFRNNPSIGDILCIADKDTYLVTGFKMSPKGAHGWSQHDGDDMHGILFAKGPCFKRAFKYESKENIHLYPMLAKILKLNINHRIDGKYKHLKNLLTKECL